MKRSILLLLTFSISFIFAQAQSYTISGYMDDVSTGEKLIAANLFEATSGSGTSSNTYGFYSLTLPKGQVQLVASYLGYSSEELTFQLTKDTTINIHLISNSVLKEVEVFATKTTKIQKETQMSQVSVPVEQIEKIPALLGEVDVLKVLQLMPGVQSGGEGQSGMYVRGGSPDQNLILLDGVPVYNVSHLLGFFSVFNSDAIKNVSLTKGGFPARYGGRLSSVVEINMKEGNTKELHGEGSIGLISSRLTLEGPIDNEKTSFMVSGRRTYADLIFGPLIRNAAREEGDDVSLKLYFYDLNAKLNHKINDKHRLYLSAYMGADVFGFRDRYNSGSDDYYITDNGIDWGNITSAFRWNYMINNKLFANTTLTYSRFQFDFNVGEEDFYNGDYSKFEARYRSGIYDWAGKIDFDFVPNPTHYIRFGIGDTYHTYVPGALTIDGSNGGETLNIDLTQNQSFTHEYYAYAEDDIKLGAFQANVGLHLSGFSIKDHHYFYPQPRVGLRYLLNNDWSVKASFATMAQYINLLTNESLNLPTDLWVPSTREIKPQTSWQAAIGAATTLKNDYELSLEAYYKKMDNVVSYKEGANFIDIQDTWENKITQGSGKSYGAEFLAQKKFGTTTGWLGYTLSWNKRQFDDINSGKEFPYKYDRRHDIEMVVSHQFSDRFSLSGTWVYGTGNAISLPEASYIGYLGYDDEGNIYSNYFEILGEKNSFRMPAYHRMDLSIEFTKEKRWGERAWVFSVYNVYNRKNPFFVYLGRDFDTDKKSFKQVSLFPVIPSFSYRFKF